jgi:hypothetical protein
MECCRVRLLLPMSRVGIVVAVAVPVVAIVVAVMVGIITMVMVMLMRVNRSVVAELMKIMIESGKLEPTAPAQLGQCILPQLPQVLILFLFEIFASLGVPATGGCALRHLV